MKFYRIPTKQEEQLIELLVHKSSLKMSEDWKNGLLGNGWFIFVSTGENN